MKKEMKGPYESVSDLKTKYEKSSSNLEAFKPDNTKPADQMNSLKVEIDNSL